MTNQYHATPYDISASGFYFTSYEDYQLKASNHKNQYGDPVEEYEIQFIDSDLPWCNGSLFKALGINQTNLETWFNDFEGMGMEDAAKAIYLSDYVGYDIADILDRLDDIVLFQGTAQEYAEDYIDDTGLLSSLPENLRYYFDTKAFAADMVMSGDVTEVQINNTDYVAWGG